jgi:hypothetical protein
MDFSALKNSSKDFAALAKKLEEASGTKKDYKDNRFWQPTKDKSKNAFAIIRFLPERQEGELPFEKTFQHSWKGPTGQWYIEECPTTIGRKDCPSCNANSDIWNAEGTETQKEANKKLVRSRKRKLYYIFNIYVVSDPANKETEGKVFLAKFGQKVFDKITAKTNPEFEHDKPINVFSLWDGANFRLKITEKDEFPNYDGSEFEAPAPLHSDDKVLEAVWKAEYDLSEFKAPERFKSEEELQKQLNRALGLKGATTPSSPAASGDAKRMEQVAATPAKSVDAPEAPKVQEPEDDDDNIEDILKKLAGG